MLDRLIISYSEIKERIKSETPDFFKRLRNIALVILTSTAAAYTINSTMGLGLNLDFLSYVIVVCAAVAGTSQLPKKD